MGHLRDPFAETVLGILPGAASITGHRSYIKEGLTAQRTLIVGAVCTLLRSRAAHQHIWMDALIGYDRSVYCLHFTQGWHALRLRITTVHYFWTNCKLNIRFFGGKTMQMRMPWVLKNYTMWGHQACHAEPVVLPATVRKAKSVFANPHLTDGARYFSVEYTGPRHTNRPASDPIHQSACDCDIMHAIRHLLRQQERGKSNSHSPPESCVMQLMLLLSVLWWVKRQKRVSWTISTISIFLLAVVSGWQLFFASFLFCQHLVQACKCMQMLFFLLLKHYSCCADLYVFWSGV